MRFSAIDIGSNAVKCLIATVQHRNGIPEVIRDEYIRVPVRLGSDVFANGEISLKLQSDVFEAVNAFHIIMKLWNVEKSCVAATSAMRDARNGKDIMQHIHATTGVKALVLDGNEEASFLASMLVDLCPAAMQSMIVDTGGGSVQISFANDKSIVATESFKLGAVRILMNGFDEAEWRKLCSFIDKHRSGLPVHVVATGGNISALFSHCGDQDKQQLRLSALRNAYDHLQMASLEERTTLYGIHPDRADVIVPAAGVFIRLLQYIASDRIMVPRVNLADALVLKLFKGEL